MFLMLVHRSVNIGSILMWMVQSFERARPACRRTDRLASTNAFEKVVCSCGKNGLRMMPTLKAKNMFIKPFPQHPLCACAAKQVKGQS